MLFRSRGALLVDLTAALTDFASAKNSTVYLAMSSGLASARRTVRRDWRSISATQSVTNGSDVAITNSCGVTCTGKILCRSAYTLDMLSATLPTSTLSGSIRKYGSPMRPASHCVRVSMSSGLPSLRRVMPMLARRTSAGWALVYTLINATTKITLPTGVASGSDYVVTVPAATSANYAAGAYSYMATVTLAGERYTVETGTVTIRANLSAQTTYDNRSPAREALDESLEIRDVSGVGLLDDRALPAHDTVAPLARFHINCNLIEKCHSCTKVITQ